MDSVCSGGLNFLTVCIINSLDNVFSILDNPDGSTIGQWSILSVDTSLHYQLCSSVRQFRLHPLLIALQRPSHLPVIHLRLFRHLLNLHSRPCHAAASTLLNTRPCAVSSFFIHAPAISSSYIHAPVASSSFIYSPTSFPPFTTLSPPLLYLRPWCLLLQPPPPLHSRPCCLLLLQY